MTQLRQATHDAVREGVQASSRVIAERVCTLGRRKPAPETVLDVGAGEGWVLDAIEDVAPSACVWGVDLATQLDSLGYFRSGVAGSPWDAERGETLPMVDANGARVGTSRPGMPPPEKWDVAVCLEVAEHLTPEAGLHLIRELTRVSHAVVWSAAIPGQGGDGHVNEQWPAYWHERFTDHGWRLHDPWRRDLWEEPRLEPWYAQNLLVAHPTGGEWEAPRALVHPRVWAHHRGVEAPR